MRLNWKLTYLVEAASFVAVTIIFMMMIPLHSKHISCEVCIIVWWYSSINLISFHIVVLWNKYCKILIFLFYLCLWCVCVRVSLKVRIFWFPGIHHTRQVWLVSTIYITYFFNQVNSISVMWFRDNKSVFRVPILDKFTAWYHN